MKFKKILNVTDKEFYNLLYTNLQKEFKVEGQLKEGMKFKKTLQTKMNIDTTSEVEISKLIENKEYELIFTTSLGANKINYTITPINENSIEVVYEEAFHTNSSIRKYNQILMELFFKRRFKKNTNALLTNVEQYIIENRNK